MKKVLNKLTKLDLLTGLDEFWTFFLSEQDSDCLQDMVIESMQCGQKGYYALSKPALINYILKQLSEEEIKEWFLDNSNYTMRKRWPIA